MRLLPDVVKIGVDQEMSPPPSEEESENLLTAPADASEVSALSGTSEKKEKKQAMPDPAIELKERIARIEKELAAAEAAKGDLAKKNAVLTSDLAAARENFAQKERELAAQFEASKEQARSEARQQGHAEGLENGYKAGLDKAHKEIEAQYREKLTGLVSSLEGVSKRLEENFAELVELNQPRMLRLWQEMLKQMLHRETVLAPDAVVDVLSDVLTRLSDKNHIAIYVSPEDADLLQGRVHEEFADILRGVKHLELKSDPNVDKGSCIVETNLGVYDARWRTQLDQIDTAIDDLLQKLGKPPKVKATRKSAQAPSSDKETTKRVSRTRARATTVEMKEADEDAAD